MKTTGISFSLAILATMLGMLMWLFVDASSAWAGTWTPLVRTAPSSVGLMMLLSDGTVLCQNNGGSNWYRLSPDSQGHYVNGTWTTIQAMHDTRLYCATQILSDGRLFIAGGEYGTGTSTGETYDPLANSWTIAPPSGHRFSDANSGLLPDGRVIVGLVEGSLRSTLIYNPTTNAWATGPTALGIHNESVWAKLPDDSILFVDRNTTSAERYIPASNQWISDATVPVALYDPYGLESGAALMLPNGKVFFIGSLGHTALYTPSGSTANGSWTVGPDLPNSTGQPDGPAVILPNGKILCAVSPVPTSANHFPSPTTFCEYDYTTNAFTSVPTTTGGNLNHACYYGTMLVVPDGTALYADFNSRIYSYQPDGSPVESGKPVISSIAQNANGSFHLTGTGLNGISEGSSYGDDNQNSSNYPIVRLTATNGTVYFARTYNWSRNGLMTGTTVVSTEFTLPNGLPNGTYSLAAIANGISSDPLSIDLTPIAITLPATATEGAAPVSGTITLPTAPGEDTVVSLSSSLSSRASAPASVTVLAGQTSASFSLTIGNDALLNGAQAVAISASADGYQTGLRNIVIADNESATLSVTSSSGLSSTGGQGGPFSPSSITYTLTNTGNLSFTWTASKAASWITLSSSSGTLAAGGSTMVTVSINSAANSLAIATYTDTILFKNTTNGNGNTSRSASLVVSTPPTMAVLPASGLTSTGNVGGPFSPSNVTYTISNPGTVGMNWSASKTASWVTLSNTSGTIAGGGTASVVVSINSGANALAAGNYSDTVTFTNTGSGNGNTTRAVSLAVTLPAPVLAAEPAVTGGTSNTVSWNSLNGASTYEAQEANNPSFTNPVSNSTATTSSSFSSLSDGVTYYYRVRGNASSGYIGPWSATVSSRQDATTPSLSISGPVTTLKSSIQLSGTSSDASGVAAVQVGGITVQSSDGFAHWTATVGNLAGGNNSITVTASDGAAPPNVKTLNWSVTRLTDADADGLPDSWEDAHGLSGAERSALADPEFDGISNLLEYALNLDPKTADDSSLPKVTTTIKPEDGKRYLTFIYVRRIDGGGLQYVVETSTNASSWDTTGASIEPIGTPSANPDGITETVTVRVLPALGDTSVKFVRLRVTVQ